MGIISALEGWRCQLGIPAYGARIGLVVHTSWVNFQEKDLRLLGKPPYVWLVPDNVRHELRLLLESGIFGQKARLLLELAQNHAYRSSQDEPWDLEQTYRNSRTHKTPEELFPGTLLFAFGDLNQQEEFLRHVSGFDRHYVLVISGWDCVRDTMRVYRIDQASDMLFRRPRPLEAGHPVPPIEKLPHIQIGRVQFAPSLLHPTKFLGSYGRIYESCAFKEKYIKIYHGQAMVGAQREKLRLLQGLARCFDPLNIAMPELLLEPNLPLSREGAIIGYVMRRFEGSALRDFILMGWKGHHLETIFRRILLLLLELHNLHIIVNDLSKNNILIDGEDRVFIVDSDSFQLLNYPGGALTEIYRHPEISSQHFLDTLRDPRHECFAFAVLAFQCLFYSNPLQLRQENDLKETESSWTNTSFPLDLQTGRGSRANRQILALWEQQPEEIRRIFSDEFHFREDRSLGAWIRALEL